MDFHDEQLIRVNVAFHINDFDHWVRPKPLGDQFGEVPWMEIVVAAAAALVTIDKTWAAGEKVVERLRVLYKKLFTNEKIADMQPITLSEHIIMVLANERATKRLGLTKSQLAAKVMHSEGAVSSELERLNCYSLVICSDGTWTLRTPED